MSWAELPELAKLFICAGVGAALMVLIFVVLCQCLWLWRRVTKKDFQPAGSAGADHSDKELADIAPHRHLPKTKPPPPAPDKKPWETQSARSRTSLSSSASEGYGSMKGHLHQPRKRPDPKRGGSRPSADRDLPSLDEIRFLQVRETAPSEETPGAQGAVAVSLSYDAGEGRLRVGVISARDLRGRRPSVGGGPAPSPYAHASLFKSDPEKPEFKFKTAVQSKTSNPKFDQSFEASVKASHLSRYTLRLVVCDHHRLGQGEIAGEAELRLKGVDWKTGIDKELLLEPSTQIPFGELLVSLSYLPTSERLYVTILRATGFRNVHEPSAKVSLLLMGKSATRRRVSSSQRRAGLVFHEPLFFEIPRDKLERVRIIIVVTAAADEAEEATEPVEPDVGGAPGDDDDDDDEPPAHAPREIGQVVLGTNCAHNAHAHWEEMTLMPRVPIAHWYPIFQDI